MWLSNVVPYITTFFAGAGALVVFLYMLSYAMPKAGFAARVVASILSTFVASACGVLMSPFINLAGVGSSGQWAVGRIFKYLMLWSTGVSFEIIDPNGVLSTVRPAVLVGNHQTELDILMLGCIFPTNCSVTAKKSLRSIPFLGWFMTFSKAIFIDRASKVGARQAMKGAAEAIRSREQSVYIFPEGTRSYTKEPTLLPFKKGAFHLAIEAGAPIVPCVVANYSHVFSRQGLVFTSGKIPVKVMDPIPTKDLTAADVDRLVVETHEKMYKELIALTAEVRKTPIAVPAN